MSKNAPAVVEPASSLPTMYDPGATSDVSPEDMVLNKVYLLQDLSTAVKEGLAKRGQAILASSADDPDFVTLIDEDNPSFTAYVLDRQRTVIRSPKGGDFEYLPNDYQRTKDDRDVWVGYNYLVAIDGVDDPLPAKWLLIKTAGGPAMKKLNTLIAKQPSIDPTRPLVISASVVKRTNKAGQEYFAFQVARTEGTDEGYTKAQAMIDMGATLGGGQSTEDSGTPVERSDF